MLYTAFVALIGLAIAIVAVTPVLRSRRSLVPLVAGFMVAATPKAGIKVDDFPIPAMLFVLAGGLSYVLWRERHRASVSGATALILTAIVAWLGVRLVTLAVAGASLAKLAAVTAWFLLPALILALSARMTEDPMGDRSALAAGLEWGLLGAAAFALVQNFVGIDETTIPGVTIAWGDSYAGKPLTIWVENHDPFSKLPSTYQNGNILGPVMGFTLIMVVTRWIRSGSTGRFDLALGSLASLACLLSGSRTVILGLLAAGLMVVGQSKPRHVITGCVAALTVSVVTFRLQPGLATRFSPGYLLDSSGAGRTDQWQDVVGSGVPYRLLVGTQDWVGDGVTSEGLIGATEEVGLFGVALLAVNAWLVLRKRRFAHWRIASVVLVVAFILDSSYLVFPTLFIPFARMWAPLERSKPQRRQNRLDHEHEVVSGGAPPPVEHSAVEVSAVELSAVELAAERPTERV